MLRTKASSSRSKCIFPRTELTYLFLFFASFSNVVSRLFELGVPETQFATSEHWTIKTVEEQKEQK